MTSTRLPAYMAGSFLSKRAAAISDASNSVRCWALRPSFGVSKHNPVDRIAGPGTLLVVAILQLVDVHQQRLAATGGVPEGDLVELGASLVGLSNGCDRPSVRALVVVLLDCVVQIRSQLDGVGEVAVEIDLHKQQGEVLEVLPPDWFALRCPLGVDGVGVGDDVVVVLLKQFDRQGSRARGTQP